MEQEKDKSLWKMAKKRAGFKRHFFCYVVVIGFLWTLWFFTGREDGYTHPWPIYPMLGWGIGLAFNFYGAYFLDKDGMALKEYEKLKNQ